MKNANPTAKGNSPMGVQPIAFQGFSAKSESCRSISLPPRLGTTGNRLFNPFMMSMPAATLKPAHSHGDFNAPVMPPPCVISSGSWMIG